MLRFINTACTVEARTVLLRDNPGIRFIHRRSLFYQRGKVVASGNSIYCCPCFCCQRDGVNPALQRMFSGLSRHRGVGFGTKMPNTGVLLWITTSEMANWHHYER